MPVERVQVSVSQFCELVGIDPRRFISIERTDRKSTTVTIVMEPDDDGTNERRDSSTQ